MPSEIPTESSKFTPSEAFPTVGDWWKAALWLNTEPMGDPQLAADLTRLSEEGNREEMVQYLGTWFQNKKLIPQGIEPNAYATEYLRWSLPD